MQTSRDADSARGQLSLARAGSNQVWWIDGVVDVKLTASETDGHLGLWYWIGRRGAASPLHVHHREEEHFLIVEGQIRFFIDGERIDGGPGDRISLPRDIPHAYLVTSETAKAVGMVTPGGFEAFFTDVGAPVRPGETSGPSPEIAAVNAAALRQGVETLGPPPALD
jgi:quercetin dioxygenase-like cupin family protein